MEQRIQYTTTVDGTRIAYTVAGSGPALVYQPGYPFNHLRTQMELEPMRAFYERLATGCTLIRYDDRATGLSQRDRLPASFDDLLADLEAVVSAASVDRVCLAGWGFSGSVVTRYVLRHADEVERLVLIDTAARSPVSYGVSRIQALLELAMADWELFSETVANVYFGWDEGGAAREFARYLRACTSPEAVAGVADIRVEDDTEVYSKLTVPTLVIKHEEGIIPPMEGATELASLIPGAELVVLEGPWISTNERAERLAATILEFIGAGEAVARPAQEAAALRTVLFTDLVGHTEMMSRLGDERGREVLREHERITREVLAANGGTEVKTMGDGFMASFGSVTKAVECAVALQRAFAQHEGERLSIRCGLNAGEPIEEEGDLFGATVILASRIAAKADGGEILVADTVRGLCSGKGFLFSDRGEFVAKGFEEPVRVYEVSWRERE